MQTNSFDLSGYTAEDLPVMYFNYALDGTTNDQVSVRVYSNANPGGVLVASSNLGDDVELLNGDNIWRQARLPLSQFAGQSDVRLEFEFQTAGISVSQGLYLDDFIVGFAERGELVTGSSFVTASSVGFVQVGEPGTFTSGAYQLEVRPGTDFADTVGDRLIARESFDTNDRQTEAITLIAPAGYQLDDGDFFELSDGFVTQQFEFNSTGGVRFGRVAVPFTPTSTPADVAAAMIAAINSPSVQAKVSFSAASSGGIVGGSTLGDARVNLFGNVRGDFAELEETELAIAPSIDSEALSTSLLGNGLSLVPGSSLLLGNAADFSGGKESIGIEEGIVLTTGSTATIQGFNLDNDTTGTAFGFGDDDLDNIPGLLPPGDITVDSSALEFQFGFDDTTVPGNLFLELAFASEEFFKAAAGRDVASILLIDESGTVTPIPINGQGTIGSGNAPSTSVINNDPTSSGKFLDQLGFDGITRPMVASITGLDPTQNWTVRIVVADVADAANPVDALDSALFIRAGSFSTEDPGNINLIAENKRVSLPAVIHTGKGDQNTRRQQGQVLLHSNIISDVQAYGIWIEGAEREQDPEDFRAQGSPTGFGSGLPHQFLGQPYLGRSYGGAVRNLRALNNSVDGGLVPGVVAVNNLIDQAGVSGISVEGTSNPWIINTTGTFGAEEDTTDDLSLNTPRNADVHFGDAVHDGDQMTITAAGLSVLFEFEDISGDVTADGGSGAIGGNGVTPGAVPIYYRKDSASTYNPNSPRPIRSYGSSEHEVIAAIYDAIIGSVLVTNDLVALVKPTIGPSIIEDSITANIGVERTTWCL
ncbi:MAG: choice-of-anchor L domain-containing protein [Pirellulaceae bacterium]